MNRRTLLAASLAVAAGCIGGNGDTDGPADEPQPDSNGGDTADDTESNDDTVGNDATDHAEPEPQVEIGSVTVGRYGDDGTVTAVDQLERGETIGADVRYRFSSVTDPIDVGVAVLTDGEAVAGTAESHPPVDSSGDDETTVTASTEDLDPGAYTVRVSVSSGSATDSVTTAIDVVANSGESGAG